MRRKLNDDVFARFTRMASWSFAPASIKAKCAVSMPGRARWRRCRGVGPPVGLPRGQPEGAGPPADRPDREHPPFQRLRRAERRAEGPAGQLLGEEAVLFKEKINFKMPGAPGSSRTRTPGRLGCLRDYYINVWSASTRRHPRTVPQGGGGPAQTRLFRRGTADEATAGHGIYQLPDRKRAIWCSSFLRAARLGPNMTDATRRLISPHTSAPRRRPHGRTMRQAQELSARLDRLAARVPLQGSSGRARVGDAEFGHDGAMAPTASSMSLGKTAPMQRAERWRLGQLAG